MSVWIEALRLRTLPLSAAGVIVAAGLASYFEAFRIEVFVPMLVMVLLLQILSNFADEYGDLDRGADNDDRVGPKRGMQRGEIGRAQMKRALVCCGILTFAVGMTTLLVSFGLENAPGVVLFAALGLFCIAAAVKYTVGKGAYGYHALGDIVCFCCFGLIAVIGGFFLYGHFMKAPVVLPAVGLGLLVCGMLNLNNMRDNVTDAASDKKTLVVVLGMRNARRYHVALLVGGMVMFAAFSVACGVTQPLRYLYLLLYIPLAKQLADTLKVTDPAEYDRFMKPHSMTTAALAFAFALCIGI